MVLLLAVILLQAAIISWQFSVRARIKALREEVAAEAEARQKLAAALQKKAQQAMPAAGPKAVILTTRRRMNVRSGPTTRSRRKTRLRKGAVVKEVSSDGAWVKVAYGTKTGWVSGKYLQPVIRVKVKVRRLNARTEPSARSAKAGTLKRGDIRKVVDYQGKWFCLKLNPGVTGWVHRKYVSALP